MHHYVYYLDDPDTGSLLYIGRSNNPEGRRWSFERRTGIAAVLSLFRQRFADIERACDAERAAIAFHMPPHNKVIASGKGRLGTLVSDEARQKMSAAKRGVLKSEEHKRKLRAQRWHHTEATKAKMKAYWESRRNGV